jgi:predicted AlkP superfamily phosphohydrolase/phosphomutase
MPRWRSRSVALSAVLSVVLGCGGDRAPGGSTSTPGKVAGVPGGTRTLEALRPQRPNGRLVMLGFDGVDPDWLEDFIKQGKLPALAKLTTAHGGRAYRRLRSTNPPQSPVAWTSFATGTHPGAHGIFDFIGRSFGGDAMPVIPKVATTSFEVQPSGPPVARNLRTGQPFWQLLGNAAVRVVALNTPYSFPPDPMRDGRMLSGLGVPDLRETNSTFTYVGTDVTDEQVARPPGGGAMIKLAMQGTTGRFELEGPSVPGGKGRMKLPVELSVQGAKAATLTVGGVSTALKVGELSGFVELSFEREGTTIVGIARAILLEAGKQTRLFVSPISIHPRTPYSPIAYPTGFSGELADELGHLYKTVGWDHDTSALNAEVIDEAQFLADVEATELDRRAMLDARLAKDDWDLLIWVSTAPDRVSHMFTRLTDPQHPRYDAALAKKYGGAIEAEYARMDQTVARVQSKLKPGDTLLILSDHGFHNYRRGLHVNHWLVSQGLMTLKGGASAAGREFFLDVDWSATKAYALGTGQIYLNRKGREPKGNVTEAEAPALVKRIRDGLLALRDTERADAEVVRAIYVGSEVFTGARAADRPDVQVAFAEHYRTSWESILGGAPAAMFADNTKKWSGDHAASDVADTDGILIANVPLAGEHPAIVDLAPTALGFFGKPVPAHYVGKSVLAGSAR